MSRLDDVLMLVCGLLCALLLPSSCLPDKCLQPYSAGNCSNHAVPVPQPQVRWYYNSTTNTCQIFIYTGCGGTANNFNSTDYCYHACNNTGNSTGDGVHTYAVKKTATLEKETINGQSVAGAANILTDSVGVTQPTAFAGSGRIGAGPTTKAPELISGVQSSGVRGPRRKRSHHDDHDDSTELDADEIRSLKGTVSKLHHAISKLQDSTEHKKSDHKTRALSGKRQAKKAAKKQQKLEASDESIVKKVISDTAYSFAPKDASRDDLKTLAEVSSGQTVDALKNEVEATKSRRNHVHKSGKSLKSHSDRTIDEEEEEEEETAGEEKKTPHENKEHHHKHRSSHRRPHHATHKSSKKEEFESPEKKKQAEFERMVSAELQEEEDDEIEIVSEKIKRIISDPVYVFSCNNISAEDLNTLHEMTAQSELGLMKLELKEEHPQLTSVARDAVIKDAATDVKVTATFEGQTDPTRATPVGEEPPKKEGLTIELAERSQPIADDKANKEI